MKKWIAMFLLAAMMLSCFAGCKKDENGNGQLAGGWSYLESYNSDYLEDENALDNLNQLADDEAMKGLEFVCYCGYLEMQSDGIDYLYLVFDENDKALKALTINLSMNGDYSVKGTKAIDLSAYAGTEVTEQELAETEWKLFKDYKTDMIATASRNLYTSLTEGLEKYRYKTVVELGTQVVAGVNTLILTKRIVKKGSRFDLCVLNVYTDTEGNSTLTGIADFNLDAIHS